MWSRQDYVVIDVETTGVLRNKDRIIEIALIRWRDDQVVSEWTTLLNPDRDLGPTNIHGITAAQVLHAPRFTEVAGDIIERLRGAVLVGHNVQFDMGLLKAEFDRADIQLGTLASICTMGLAYEFGPSQRRLDHCCSHFGIVTRNAHSAQHDATAALALFKKYLTMMKQSGISLEHSKAYKPGDSKDLPGIKPSGKQQPRGESTSVWQTDYIASLIQQLPDVGSLDTARYYAALDLALEDRRITSEEAQLLTALAIESGISQQAAIQANYDYLQALVQLALADRYLTASELSDLQLVAKLLNVSDADLQHMIENVKAAPVDEVPARLLIVGAELKGQTVCFTGTLISKLNGEFIGREKAEELASLAGLLPVKSVTKKTNILVIADPDSMSGKAKKAREYGTRIMAEQVFWKAIGVEVE